MHAGRPWTFAYLLVGWLWAALAWGQAPVDPLGPALGAADLDRDQCLEFPPNPRTEPYCVTPASLPAFLRLEGAAPPHTFWRTGEGREPVQHLRLAFARPVVLGTLVALTDGRLSVLRPEAAYPGEVNREADWLVLPDPHPAGRLRVVPLPQGLATRAVRVSFPAPATAGEPRRSEVAGMRLLRGRFANLAWKAVPLADSEAADNERDRETFGRQQLNDGEGTGPQGQAWRHRPGQPLSTAEPAWVALLWDRPQRLAAVGFFDLFAKHFAVDAYAGPADVHPLTAPAGAWAERAQGEWPIWWRPAYTDAFVALPAGPPTRALRVRLTAALTNENPDIAYRSQGQATHAGLAELLALQDLDAQPVAAAIALASPEAPAARVSTNRGQEAVPAPGAVAVDGRLGEWDTSAGIFMCPDTQRLTDVAAAWGYVMYDAEALYVALDVADPTPLANAHDPGSEPGLGWGGDCVQLRLRTDRVVHLTTWYSAARRVPVVHVAYGAAFDGGEVPNATAQAGVAAAFRRWDDGAGYTEELRLPWSLITADGAPRPAGTPMALHYDLKWGTRDHPETSFADNLAAGVEGRDGTWRDPAVWGDLRVVDKGWRDRAIAPWVTPAAKARDEQPVAIACTLPDLPAGQPENGLTMVVDDAGGRRVRNLVTGVSRPAGALSEGWDGLDDQGNPVPPGTYRWRAIVRPPVHLRYQFTVNHAGSPPWLAGTTGGWLSDHAPPQSACAVGDQVYIGAAVAENGHTLLAVDGAGRKVWGTKWLNLAGAQVLASDAAALYVGSEGGWIQAKLQINRVDPATQAFRNVIEESYPKVEETPGLDGLAVRAGRAYLSLRKPGVIAVYALPEKADAKGTKVAELPLLDPGGLAFDPKGDLWAVSGNRVVRFAGGVGQAQPVVTRGLAAPRQLAFGPDGRLYVSDGAPAHDVKVFSAQGEPAGTIGQPGGRTVGPYDPRRMDEPWGLAIDARGRLWVSEHSTQPKRVSLWSPAGEFLRAFHGPTRYGGSGYLDATDVTRLHDDGMTFAIDWEHGTWDLRDVHYRYQGGPGMSFLRTPGRSWSYRGRTFLSNYDYWTSRYLVLYERLADGRIVPLASAGAAEFAVGHTTTGVALWAEERFAVGLAGRDPKDLNYLWTDRNRDGDQQPDEVRFFQTPAGGTPHWRWGALWSLWITEDCGFVVAAMGNGPRQYAWKLPVTEWLANGAPAYDPEHPRRIADVPRRQVPVYSDTVQSILADDRDRAILIANPITGCDESGQPLWTYEDPWPGVHGSHSAPSYEPGMVIGGLLALGMARLDGDLGQVFAISGNKGQVYLFTTDGLLVATLFQDCRVGRPWSMPQAQRGMLLDELTLGEEHFGGHFTRSSDGRYYLVVGSNHSSLVEIEGLDRLQRLEGTVEVTPALAARCDAVAREKAFAAARREAPRVYTARAAASPPVLDGDLADWADAEFAEWQAANGKARAALRWDAATLYAAFAVKDSSPLVNRGNDARLLFKTGDAVDLMLATDPAADPDRRQPVPGDLRLLVTAQPAEGALRPVAVLYRHRVPGTPPAARVTFSSPWRSEDIDQVVRLDPGTAAVAVQADGYTVEVAVPLAVVGWKPGPQAASRCDFGVLFGDAAGETTIERSYWSNRSANFTTDVPGEAMLYPNFWGALRCAER